MPQVLDGTGIVRETPAARNGPPRGPAGLRVSLMRHGGTATNCSGTPGVEELTIAIVKACAAETVPCESLAVMLN